ncbi:MAG TPA: acyltransferase [Polyangiaceae bacterium]
MQPPEIDELHSSGIGSALSVKCLTEHRNDGEAKTGLGRALATPGRFHIPSLDGLRAISFLMVFLAHAGLDRIVPGGFGVTVFFFLSGYLITTLMRMEVSGTGHLNIKHFYLRRALRIFPPFYIVLTLGTLLGKIGLLRSEPAPQWMPVTAQALHISNYWIAEHGWKGIASGTGVYWSLAVEEHFYVVFPAVFLLVGRLHLSGRQKAMCLWAACALVLVWRCALVFAWSARVDRTYLCSDTRFDSILFGCALAVWNNPIMDFDRPTSNRAIYRYGLVAAGVCLLLVTFVVRSSVFRETLRYTLQGIALTPIFVAAIRWPRWFLFRPLNWAPTKFIGTLTYSLYLVHQAVLAMIEQHMRWGPAARALVALPLSVVLAWTIYWFVEKPCARVRRRLSTAEPRGRPLARPRRLWAETQGQAP